MNKDKLKVIIQTALVVSSFWVNVILFNYGSGKKDLLFFIGATGFIIIVLYLVIFMVYVFVEK